MLTLIAVLIVTAVAIPNVVVATELLAGLKVRPLLHVDANMPDTCVLMPAHDEAGGIASVLAQVLPLLPTQARLLVVADNCNDETAAMVRASGVAVTERTDPTRRGKGYALDHGRTVLAAGAQPDVVIVLDADCIPEPGSIERLARAAAAYDRPVQASYLLKPKPSASPMVRISGFAFLVKNLVRQAGLARLGMPAVLTGSGMAFPWPAFAAAPLATDDIVEDLSIGIALARVGAEPLYDPAATIWSAPANEAATLGQRTRWEHGYMRIARTVAVPLVVEGIRHGRGRLSWLGLHVAVPPLALLLMGDVVALLLLLTLGLAGSSIVPFILATLIVGTVGLAVIFAWNRHGREQVDAVTLARIPIYIIWKLPIYLKLFRRREVQWIRTDRE